MCFEIMEDSSLIEIISARLVAFRADRNSMTEIFRWRTWSSALFWMAYLNANVHMTNERCTQKHLKEKGKTGIGIRQHKLWKLMEGGFSKSQGITQTAYFHCYVVCQFHTRVTDTMTAGGIFHKGIKANRPIRG